MGEYHDDICIYCGQEIKTWQQGLINFGDQEHMKVCPSLHFRHCPNCGYDIDFVNSYQYIEFKGLKKREQFLRDKFGS